MTSLIVTDTDRLSRAADAIVAKAPGISKNTVLNMLAAEIAGGKHNWGYLKGRETTASPGIGLAQIAPSRPSEAETRAAPQNAAMALVACLDPVAAILLDEAIVSDITTLTAGATRLEIGPDSVSVTKGGKTCTAPLRSVDAYLGDSLHDQLRAFEESTVGSGAFFALRETARTDETMGLLLADRADSLDQDRIEEWKWAALRWALERLVRDAALDIVSPPGPPRRHGLPHDRRGGEAPRPLRRGRPGHGTRRLSSDPFRIPQPDPISRDRPGVRSRGPLSPTRPSAAPAVLVTEARREGPLSW